MDRPPVLLITMDELLREALGCYGGRAAATPAIDRLAGQSLRFDRAYTVSPWCLPARCSILTGLLPHNSGAYSNFRKCASVALPRSACSRRVAISSARRRFVAALTARSLASLPAGPCSIFVETKCCFPAASRYEANQ